MKRTLTLFLLGAVANCALAQTPKVVEKTVAPVRNAAAVHNQQVAAASTHTTATNAKVVAVSASPKPSPAAAKPAGKPAVIAVQPAAKPAVAVVPAKPAPAGQKGAVVVAKPQPAVAAVKPAATGAHVVAVKPAPQASKTVVAARPMAPAKAGDPFNKKKSQPEAKGAVVAAKAPEKPKTGAVVAVNENKPTEEKKPEPKKISATARRDPFVSPVVKIGVAGSGCSSGKRCLAIDQIALKGIVRSENGMIAVVVNAMDKAYFLRENDPVFNGYVTKITPDSVIFKETFRDRLGKELTRDVTKTISRPAA